MQYFKSFTVWVINLRLKVESMARLVIVIWKFLFKVCASRFVVDIYVLKVFVNFSSTLRDTLHAHINRITVGVYQKSSLLLMIFGLPKTSKFSAVTKSLVTIFNLTNPSIILLRKFMDTWLRIPSAFYKWLKICKFWIVCTLVTKYLADIFRYIIKTTKERPWIYDSI